MKTIDAADVDNIGGFGAQGDGGVEGSGSRVEDAAASAGVGTDPEDGSNWLVEQR